MSLIIIDESETDDVSLDALREFLQSWQINTVDDRVFISAAENLINACSLHGVGDLEEVNELIECLRGMK